MDGQLALTDGNGGESVVETPQRLTLRPYQQIGCDRTWSMFWEENYDRLLGVAATGSGKTVMFSDLAQRAVNTGGRALILVDQMELVDQAVARMYETTGAVAGIEQADRNADPRSKVIVSTVQSMRRRLDKYAPDNFSLVITDEADRSAANQWRDVLARFDAHAKVLGVTATPKRADRRDIMEYFQAKAFDITLFDLIREGYLARITVRTVPLKIDIRDVKQRQGDFDADQLDDKLRSYFVEICDAIKEYAADRKVLIFWPLIRTSEAFVRVCREQGLEARHIDGGSADREALQEEYRRGEFRILSNALLLSRGWDEPSVDCIINCRVTRHETMYRQIIGRGTRIWCPNRCAESCDHPERKLNLLVLDFLWQFERFNIMRPADLIAKNKRAAEALTERLTRGDEIDLEAADSEVAAALEQHLIDAFNKRKKRKGTVFDALEWAANMDIRDLVDFEPETARDLRPLTEYQVQRLEKAGFLLESVRGFGHAYRIIEVLNERMRAGLATFKQVHWLRRFGVPNAMNVTFDEASKLLDRFFNKK